MFIDREQELAFLNSLLKQPPSPAQLVLLYGRRRVGKTVLARRWAEQSGLPTFYWAAERETAPLQRRKLFARILGVSMSQAPTFESWADLWTAHARREQSIRHGHISTLHIWWARRLLARPRRPRMPTARSLLISSTPLVTHWTQEVLDEDRHPG